VAGAGIIQEKELEKPRAEESTERAEESRRTRQCQFQPKPSAAVGPISHTAFVYLDHLHPDASVRLLPIGN